MIFTLAVALIACGAPADDTQTPETDPADTDVVVSESESETEAPACNGVDIHDVVVDEKPASCSDRGYRIETCKTCGEILFETAYPKQTCTPSGEATCTSASVCTQCGQVLEAAKGHTPKA